MRLAAVLAFVLAFAAPAFAVERMKPKNVASAIEAGKVVLVDIRTPAEWAETGVAAPATLIDMKSPHFIDDLLKVFAANPGKRVAFICRSGSRSSGLANLLEKRGGMKDLIDVAGGMAGNGEDKGWVAEGLPVRKP